MVMIIENSKEDGKKLLTLSQSHVGWFNRKEYDT